MDVAACSALLNLLAVIILIPLTAFSLLVVKILIGKSIGDPGYPPVRGTVFNMAFCFNRLYDRHTENAKRNPTFRLLASGQSLVCTVDPRNVEHIMKTAFDRYTKGEYNREITTEFLGEGIFMVDGDKWRQQRKLASFEFSTRVLRDFSCSVFRKNAARLVGFLGDMAARGMDFDVQDILLRVAMDSIIKVGFGIDLNCLEDSKEGSVFMKAFDEANALIFRRYFDPLWRLKRYFNICAEASLRKNIEIIDTFVIRLIRGKRELLVDQRGRSDKEDILSRFLLAGQEDPEKMNDKYLRDIILSFILAGRDTTGNTLSWFLYMLCKNPLVQETIFQEIMNVVVDEGRDPPETESRDNDDDPDEFVRKVTKSALDGMHYLHAALSETLRLYPAVPIDGRKAEMDDVLPDGYKVKKGDMVYNITFAMGRMKSLWGDDYEDFKPERWLKDGIFQPESPFKFAAFNAGPRICLGKDFAYRQMKIVSIALLRFFRFKLADETRAVTYRTMLTLHIRGGLHLNAVPRMRL